MQRRALIAANAAGNPETVAGVLARFGFSRTAQAADREGALAQMRDAHFDLVIIGVDAVTPAELVALEREIRKDPNTSVIATAMSAEPDLIVRAMRAGVHEFLVNPPKPEELAGSVERLMRRTRTETEQGELIAIYSGKGGLGSTSIAVNLAQAFATVRNDARVALVDLVVAGGDVRVFLNLKPSYDISHLIAKGSSVDAELLNSVLTPCPGGVWALPTGDSPEDQDMFDSAAVGSVLTLLRQHFAITVVDCEHHLSEATLAALDAADRIMLVTQLTVPALRSTQRSLTVCRRLGYDESKLCVVINRYQSGDVLPVKDAEDLLQTQIYWKLPNDYRLSATSLTRGVPVTLEDPNSKLAKSYTDLVRKISGTPAPASAPGSQDGSAGSRFRKLFGNDRGVRNVS
ncbi:MAG TPA: P-loop NTPase [Gemmatimonadaceae bacterium]|nr:P-loop NTPase [Gemmatimonadaceae bacterium]